jgi:two-component system chemotaxis response regulator CheY
MPKRVLIVDDSPVMRAFVRRVLEAGGDEYVCAGEAGDGRAALERLAEERFDIVLSDIHMPGMDGEELLRRVRMDSALRAIPVVMVSTDSTEHRVGRLMEMGAAGYVRKPFRPERLGEVLSRIFPCGLSDKKGGGEWI